MTQIAALMTRDPVTVGPLDTLQRAAQLMAEFNVGSLPVCRDELLLGLVTDRDITVRAVAAGLDPATTTVGEVMSEAPLLTCAQDAEISEALLDMARQQVRRLPVVDAARRLVGIVSLGDFAARRPQGVQQALQSISLPAQPDRDGVIA